MPGALTLESFLGRENPQPEQPATQSPELNLDSFLESERRPRILPSSTLPDPAQADAITTATARATVAQMAPPIAQTPAPQGPTISAAEPSLLDRLIAPVREGAIGRAFHMDSQTDAVKREQGGNPLFNFGASVWLSMWNA